MLSEVRFAIAPKICGIEPETHPLEFYPNIMEDYPKFNFA